MGTRQKTSCSRNQQVGVAVAGRSTNLRFGSSQAMFGMDLNGLNSCQPLLGAFVVAGQRRSELRESSRPSLARSSTAARRCSMPRARVSRRHLHWPASFEMIHQRVACHYAQIAFVKPRVPVQSGCPETLAVQIHPLIVRAIEPAGEIFKLSAINLSTPLIDPGFRVIEFQRRQRSLVVAARLALVSGLRN